MANKADEVLLSKRPRKQATAIKNHEKCTEKIAVWERWVVSTIAGLAKIGMKAAFTLLLGN